MSSILYILSITDKSSSKRVYNIQTYIITTSNGRILNSSTTLTNSLVEASNETSFTSALVAQLLASMIATGQEFIANLHTNMLLVVATHLGALMLRAGLLLLAAAVAQLHNALALAALDHLGLLAAPAVDLDVPLASRTLACVTCGRACVEVACCLVVHVVRAFEEFAA